MKPFFYISLCFLVVACNNVDKPQKEGSKKQVEQSPEQSDCKYGKPLAIFSDELPQITAHKFESEGQKGIETVHFENQTILELYQSGCNEIRQEYRFLLPEDFRQKEDVFWKDLAIEKLTYVGNLDEKYAVLGIWVGAIEQLKDQLKIGQFSEAEPGTFIMIDKLAEPESSILMIVLERRV